MKGIGEVVGFVVTILLVIVAIGVVLAIGLPLIDQARENGVVNEAQHNMLLIDNLVKQVASEGTGSVRELPLSVSDGNYRVQNGLNSIDYELSLKSPVIPRGTYTKMGNLLTIVGGSASASQNGTNIIIENEILQVVFTKVGNQSSFDAINTSSIIKTISTKTNPITTIVPNNTGVTIQGIANTSWGLGYSALPAEGSNLERASALVHVRSNMTGVEYEVLYTLPASSDFIQVEVRNTTSNQTTLTYSYRIGQNSSNDVIRIDGVNETTFSAGGTTTTSSASNQTTNLQNTNFTRNSSSLTLSLGSATLVQYNASDGTLRNVSELGDIGQGNWSFSTNSTSTIINFTLAGQDGYDFGLRDYNPGGSYWLDQNGNLFGKINISNDFITVGLASHNLTVYNSSQKIIFNTSFDNAAKIDGQDFITTYGTGTQNKTVYFFDWAQQQYVLWQKGFGDDKTVVSNNLVGWWKFNDESGNPDVSIHYQTQSGTEVRAPDWTKIMQASGLEHGKILHSITVTISGNSGSTIKPIVYSDDGSDNPLHILYQGPPENTPAGVNTYYLGDVAVPANGKLWVGFRFGSGGSNVAFTGNLNANGALVNAGGSAPDPWTTTYADGGIESTLHFANTTSDSSGNGYTGTLINGTLWITNSSCKYNYCLGFNSSLDTPVTTNGSYVNVSYSSGLDSSSFTVEAWIYPTNNTGYRTIISKYAGAATQGSWILQSTLNDVGQYCFGVTGSSGVFDQVCAPLSAAIPLNQWTQIMAVYTAGKSLSMYQNGQLVASLATAQSHPALVQALQIGRESDGKGCCYFSGLIDNVKIFNKSLSADEILAEYRDSNVPDWLDPRNKQEFKWRYAFTKSGSPSVNVTYLMTATDPFVRQFVDGDGAEGNNVGTSGLVGSWLFNEGSGTTVSDGSGNGYTGTLTNSPQWVSNSTCKINFRNCISFANSRQAYVSYGTASTTNFVQNTGIFTVSAWMKLTDFSNACCDQGITGNLYTNAEKGWYFAYHNYGGGGQRLELDMGSGGAVEIDSFTPVNTINDNNWHYVAVQGDGTNVFFFIDGVKYTGTGTIGTKPTGDSTESNTVIGNAASAGNSYGFNGTIDDVKIWNRQLTADEIQADYSSRHNITIPFSLPENRTSVTTAEPGLVGYWNFNEGGGANTTDASGNGRSAGLINGPRWVSNSSCAFGSCLSFSGATDYVEFPDSGLPTGNVPRSVSLWFRPYDCTTTRDIFYYGSPVANQAFTVGCGFGSKAFFSPWTYTINGNTVLTAGALYNVVVTYDGNLNANVYLNGLLDGSGSTGTLSTTLSGKGHIGTDILSGGSPFPGIVDDVKVYSRILNDSEIKQLYRTGIDQRKPGVYFTSDNATANEEVLFSTNNVGNVFRTLSNTTPSNFQFFSNQTNFFGFNYTFNSTINQNFMFSLGTMGRMNTTAFSPQTNASAFSSETMESIANSTMTYYDLFDPSLAAWWKLNEGGGTLAYDSSSNNNTGTINSVTWITNSSCKTNYGNCIYTDTSSQKNVSVVNPSASILSDSYTYVVWFKFDTALGNGRYLMEVGGGTADQNIGFSSLYVLEGTSYSSGGSEAIAGSTTPSAGAWHQGVFVRDSIARKLYLYLDGNQTATPVSITSSPTANYGESKVVTIGSAFNDASTTSNFLGYMDNVKIYSRPLSPDEIKADYLAAKDDYPNLKTVNQTNGATSAATPAFFYDGGAAGIWHFDEGGGLNATDASGNGNVGTVNATWVTNSSCRFGSCLSFDGVRNNVNVSGSNFNFERADSFSFETWVKTSGTNNQEIITKDTGSVTGGMEFFATNGGSVQLRLRETAVATNSISLDSGTTKINDAVWHHIVGTYNGASTPSGIRIYIDGNMVPGVAGGTALSNTILNGGPLTIGMHGGGSQLFPLTGLLDEVRIYKRVLTDAEVREHYQQGASKYYDDFSTAANGKTYRYYGVEDSNTSLQPIDPSGTVLHYRFNDNSSVNVTDVSGSGNNGGVFNGASWIANSSCMGNFGGCMIFNVSNNYVKVPDSASLGATSGLTVSAWVKPAWFNSNGQRILSKVASDSSWSSPFVSYEMYVWCPSSCATGTVTWAINKGGSYTSISSSGSLDTTRWYHIASVSDGTNLKIYINGVLDTSSTVGGAISTTSGSLFVGSCTPGSACGNSGAFNGTLDEVMIVNRSLSADEVNQLYLGGMNRTVNGHWHRVASADDLPSVSYNLTAKNNTFSTQDYSMRMVFVNGTLTTSASTAASPSPACYTGQSLSQTFVCSYDQGDLSSSEASGIVYSGDPNSFVSLCTDKTSTEYVFNVTGTQAFKSIIPVAAATCSPIGNQTNIVQRQGLPSHPFGSYSLSGPAKLLMSLKYDRIAINGTLVFGAGQTKLCVEKAGRQGTLALVNIRIC